MKTLNNIRIIGIDHGYGNIKTANTITLTGVIPSTTRPVFGSNILRCDGMYYSCGEGHKAFISDKSGDNDYYLLTLMGAAKELRRAGISEADVYLAAGLPLTWVKSQRREFTNYLMRNERVEFEFNDRLYKLRFVGCSVFPQGYTAVIDRLAEMRGVNMLADIGNGTMNIMYITNSRPVASKCWTEKLGVNQCVIRAANAVMDRFGTKIDESIIESVLRYGKANMVIIRAPSANTLFHLRTVRDWGARRKFQKRTGTAFLRNRRGSFSGRAPPHFQSRLHCFPNIARCFRAVFRSTL